MNEDESHGMVRQRLAEKMAGEITLSEKPGETLKKWRLNFEIAQTDLSGYLSVSPSVISDYESGRRNIDSNRGGQKIHAYEGILFADKTSKAIYATYEYTFPMQVAKLANIIQADIVNKGVEKPLYGFTVVDSKKAILELSSHEFQKLYGWSTERAMIFTKVTTGKSPMVAIRVTNLKPGAVVLHGLRGSEIHMMAKKMAEIDRIPLLATTMDIDEMVEALKKYSEYHIIE